MPQQPESSSLTSRPGIRFRAATRPGRARPAPSAGSGRAAGRGPARGRRGRSGTRVAVGDEGVDQQRRRGDEVGVGAEAEVAVLVDQGQQAARLAADDRHARAGVRRRAGATFSRARSRPSGQQPLRDRRPAAAGQARQLDPVAGRLQHPHRRAADLGGVVGREAVVEQDDRPARPGAGSGRCRRNHLRRWSRANVGRVRRRSIPATFSRSHLKAGLPQRPVGQRGRRRADRVEPVDVAHQQRAERDRAGPGSTGAGTRP